MIIPSHKRLSDDELKELESITSAFGVTLQPIHGTDRSVYAMLGDERDPLMIKRIEGLSYIERINQVQDPFKLMSRESDLSTHETRIGGKTLGKELCVIAGHCAIDPDNPNAFYESAAAIKEAGGDMLRGGVWKPRTSPHAFQGDPRSLEILIEAGQRTGLPINTEVMDEDQLSIVLDAGVNSIQVGARNALNYRLLRTIGEKTKDKQVNVVLKRSIHSGPVNEFILAAEYVVAAGNPDIILCPRGTTPTIDGYRNHPDESITALLRHKTWAPVIVDPSHSVGKAQYVPFACMAAASYGAHGLLVETHCSPKSGLGDDPKQAITPEVLTNVIADCREIFARAQQYPVEF